MGFLSEVKSIAANTTRQDEIREKLGQKDYDEFIKACADDSITHVAISKALKKRGIECHANTVSRIRERIKDDDHK